MKLYLIRHGESEANKLHKQYIGGREVQTPLSSKGKEQALSLNKYLKDEGLKFDAVYASPALRTMQTASLALGHTDFDLDQRLLELNQGDWEGQLRHEIYTPEQLQKINSNNWHFRPPNGETQKEVEDRMYAWLDEIQQSGVKSVAIFGHGVAFKCLMRKLLDFPASETYKLKLGNCSVTEFKYEDENWYLKNRREASK